MKNFLNYIFKNLSSLSRREFDEKSMEVWKKHMRQRSFAPKLKERNSPAGGKSIGLRPASQQNSRMNFQLSPEGRVNDQWDFLPWGTSLWAECGKEQQRALDPEGRVDKEDIRRGSEMSTDASSPTPLMACYLMLCTAGSGTLTWPSRRGGKDCLLDQTLLLWVSKAHGWLSQVRLLWAFFSTRPQPWPVKTVGAQHKWFHPHSFQIHTLRDLKC